VDFIVIFIKDIIINNLQW